MAHAESVSHSWREADPNVSCTRPCERPQAAGSGHGTGARRIGCRAVAAGLVLAATLIVTPVQADGLDSLIERLDRLEEENRQLRQEVESLKAERGGRAEGDPVDPPESLSSHGGFVRVDSGFGGIM